jgi:hypothetical protein
VSRTYEEPESNTRYSGEKGGNRKSEETNEEFDSRYDRLLKQSNRVADELYHLNDFLNGPKRTTVSDKEIVLLELQQKYMALYSCILEVRVVENKGEIE